MKRKIEKDYYGLAEHCGFKWVGKVLPKDVKISTLWECKVGHRWKAKYNNIQQGKGCPYCSGVVKKTKQDYYELAKSRGFKWISFEVPKKVNTKTWWKCKNEHRFEMGYSSIQQGRGCPYCSGVVKKTEKDYHELAKFRRFRWVGKVLPKNVITKTLWECEKKHRWEAVYSSIQQGTGCPTCKDLINGLPVSEPQRKLNDLLCGSLNYPESRYRIDVVIMRNSQKIAVEYDCCYWHQGNEEHDAKRDNFLISCGWKIIHIKSRRLLPNRKQIKQAINKVLGKKNIANVVLDDWNT